MERSIAEKTLFARVVPETPELDYPLDQMRSKKYGTELYYAIPDVEKYEAIQAVWPFTEIPQPGDRMLDIHSGKEFDFRECLIIRWNGRNMVVSKYYFEAGGTCFDLVRPGDSGTVMTIRQDIAEQSRSSQAPGREP